MTVHQKTRDTSRASGIRLMQSTWKELEAIQLRRGHDNLQEALREAVAEYIAKYQRAA